MKVMKFGGSSVQDAAHIRRVFSIVSSSDQVRAVVCSAMKGVTNALIDAARKAESGDPSYASILQNIWVRHETACRDLLPDPGNTLMELEREFADLREICHGIYLIKECSPRSLDLVMSFGERLNNLVIAAFASSQGMEAFYVDARPLVLTDDSHGNAVVVFDESYARIREFFSTRKGTGFVTGFISSSPEGITTTLGRNGSDYSASIFGAALGAADIEIWTDVDGVLDADPRVVPEAGVIDDLSIEEAMEMSYFGAEVLHPSTMIPAVETEIPVWIKNTLNPSARGTRIAANVSAEGRPVTGIASIQDVSLVNVVGSGMVGAKGTAMKIFSAFARAGVNAIMISQASSEHSICVVMRREESAAAVQSLRKELEYELRHRIIQNIDVMHDLEVVAVIGGNMRGRPGVSGTLFDSLGKNGINILAIAQGSTEMNISFVIARKDHEACLRTVHQAFFRPR